ncbi:MAG: hypothetical protein EOO89_22710 [Pedobacter sp.]|nr:MAG: hypothetical protein EOO89_22710 [Pedobacter sp.]
MKAYGLIGYPLSHSFSKKFFEDKFADEGIKDHSYTLFTLENIGEFPDLISRHAAISGLNVTIPHKTGIIPFLDDMDSVATAIAAGSGQGRRTSAGGGVNQYPDRGMFILSHVRGKTDK